MILISNNSNALAITDIVAKGRYCCIPYKDVASTQAPLQLPLTLSISCCNRPSHGLHSATAWFLLQCMVPNRSNADFINDILAYFWTHSLQPPAGTCMSLSYWSGMYRTLGSEVSETWVHILLHELVHLYLGAIIDQMNSPRKEASRANSCFDLNANDAKYSPANYVLYVNSELSRRKIR